MLKKFFTQIGFRSDNHIIYINTRIVMLQKHCISLQEVRCNKVILLAYYRGDHRMPWIGRDLPGSSKSKSCWRENIWNQISIFKCHWKHFPMCDCGISLCDSGWRADKFTEFCSIRSTLCVHSTVSFFVCPSVHTVV